MKMTVGKPFGLGVGVIPFLMMCLFVPNTASVRAQRSTVVIAEVMYDSPLYATETLASGQEGEFMSLYNYGEEDVDVGGWRITVTSTTNGFVYQYIIPDNTILSESGLLVIASRGTGSNCDL